MTLKQERPDDDLEADLRLFYETKLVGRGQHYEHYRPAIRYGYTIATQPQWQNKKWAELEPEVQRQWEEKYGHAWEPFKLVVYQAWQEARRRQYFNLPETAKVPEAYKLAFQQHHRFTYAEHNYDYKTSEPAYLYGYNLAVDEATRDKSWAELELEARQHWEQKGDVEYWYLFGDASRHAWELVRGEAPLPRANQDDSK